ncbi:hypothetical protein ACHAWF_001297 [Thalassiosira exigua]
MRAPPRRPRLASAAALLLTVAFRPRSRFAALGLAPSAPFSPRSAPPAAPRRRVGLGRGSGPSSSRDRDARTPTEAGLRPPAAAWAGNHDSGSFGSSDAASPKLPRRLALSSSATAALAAASLALSPLLPLPASAADYGSFTPEQRFVAEAWRTVDSAYIDRTFNHQDWFQMRQDALKKKYKSADEARAEVEKMLSSLGDRYTRYLPPAKYDSIVNAATGNVCGVGVELATNKEGTRVLASDVEPNGPAFRGGLRPGDVFVEVDGVRFDDGKAAPDDVAVVVRGAEGSKVGVVAERDGKVLDFIFAREPIKITSVRGYLGNKPGGSGKKVGVVRVKNFSGTTAETVKSELESLKEKGATSFVLDLRGNPGGLLPGGVDAASLFLEADKPIVFVADKKGVVDARRTLGDGYDLDSPLVVLVDGNTASAAEVFTAALKENGRATIAGEQTFGKGIVQTIRQLEGGEDGGGNGGVAVTVAQYETPEHHDINKQGIPVDVGSGTECGKEDVMACLSREALARL